MNKDNVQNTYEKCNLYQMHQIYVSSTCKYLIIIKLGKIQVVNQIIFIIIL